MKKHEIIRKALTELQNIGMSVTGFSCDAEAMCEIESEAVFVAKVGTVKPGVPIPLSFQPTIAGIPINVVQKPVRQASGS